MAYAREYLCLNKEKGKLKVIHHQRLSINPPNILVITAEKTENQA